MLLLLNRPRAQDERNGINILCISPVRSQRRSPAVTFSPSSFPLRLTFASAKVPENPNATFPTYHYRLLTPLLFQETAKSGKEKTKNGKDVDAVDEVRLYCPSLSPSVSPFVTRCESTPVIAGYHRL